MVQELVRRVSAVFLAVCVHVHILTDSLIQHAFCFATKWRGKKVFRLNHVRSNNCVPARLGVFFPYGSISFVKTLCWWATLSQGNCLLWAANFKRKCSCIACSTFVMSKRKKHETPRRLEALVQLLLPCCLIGENKEHRWENKQNAPSSEHSF